VGLSFGSRFRSAPGLPPPAADAGRMADLVLLTVNGVAAGLQNTG
jgi:phosphoenolpyruvate carboxylase